MIQWKEGHEEKWLEEKGVKPTANRVIVLKALSVAKQPKGLIELEDMIETMDKSSIFRVLSLFVEHEVVHVFEDGKGILKYELCTVQRHCSIYDTHIHFYCEVCQQTFCLKSQQVPEVKLPDGYAAHSINYMVKGICPKCKKNG